MLIMFHHIIEMGITKTEQKGHSGTEKLTTEMKNSLWSSTVDLSRQKTEPQTYSTPLVTLTYK